MNGTKLIELERLRQIEEEGWTAEHDDAHINGELVFAAAHYALPEGYENEYAVPNLWPWIDEDDAWDKKPKHERIRQLVIAGAFIAAEIDRLQRAGNAAAYTEPKCDPEVYQNGTVVAMITSITFDECEAFVDLVSRKTGQKVDWFPAAGHRIVKAVGDVGKVREWIRDYLRRRSNYRIVEENGEWS